MILIILEKILVKKYQIEEIKKMRKIKDIIVFLEKDKEKKAVIAIIGMITENNKEII